MGLRKKFWALTDQTDQSQSLLRRRQPETERDSTATREEDFCDSRETIFNTKVLGNVS